MANQSNDDLARALAGLAAGEHTDHEDHLSDGQERVEHAPPPPAPPRPAATRPVSGVPRPASTAARPPVPGKNPSTAASSGPATRPSSPAAPRPVRPAAPGAPPAAAAGSVQRPAAPSPARPASAARPTAPGSTASRPAAPAPARPSQPGAVAKRPATPQRPATPGAAPARPAAPARSAEPELIRNESAPAIPSRSHRQSPATPDELNAEHDQQAEAMTHVVEDDDSVIVPAAPLEYLGHQTTAPSRPKLRGLQTQSLEARRTAIPVLLTTSVMLIVAGVLKFLVGDSSPLSDFPLWMPIVLFALAVPMLAIAVLNMLQVRQELEKRRAEQEPQALIR